MPAVIQRGRVEYFKDVDISDLKRLPKENKQLRKQVQSQELQLAEKSKEAHDLQVELASERGLRQGVELGVKLALQAQAQAQMITSGIGAGSLQIRPLERKYLEPGHQGRVESESLSSSSRTSVRPSSSASERGTKPRTAQSSVSSVGPSSSVSEREAQPGPILSSVSRVPSVPASKSLHSSRFPKPPRDTDSANGSSGSRRSVSDNTRTPTPRSASVFSADRRISSLPESLSTLGLSDRNHSDGPIEVQHQVSKKQEKKKGQGDSWAK